MSIRSFSGTYDFHPTVLADTGADQRGYIGREVVAHHEAGHAVAVLMRGGTRLHYIDIEGGEDYAGRVEYQVKGWGDDHAFITYAGPWAEARARWVLADLDSEDDDGCTFDDYVASAFIANIDGDGELYVDLWNREHPELRKFQTRREKVWTQELEREWPVIQEVAQLLLADGANMYYSPGNKTWHNTIEELLGG